MDFSDISLLVLAGGKSSRLGQDKRWVTFDGISALENLLRKAIVEPFAKRYLCVEAVDERLQALAEKYDLEILVDENKEQGAIEGLRHGLSSMPTDYALAVSCDMPLYTFAMARPLMRLIKDGETAIVPVAGGRPQPLAAIYHRDLAKNFAEAMHKGENNLSKILEMVEHRQMVLEPEAAFFSIDTPADLRLVRGRLANEKRTVPVVTIAAPASGTGKTTFIEKLIPELNKAGYHVGVVKDDCPNYNIDAESQDNDRFDKAGAESVAVVSSKGYLIQHKTEEPADLMDVASQLVDVDLVLIESRHHGVAPKISLWRGLGEPQIDSDTAALFTSEPKASDAIRTYDINDIPHAIELIKFLLDS